MTAANDWLIAGGETGELIRSMNWSATPLGPRDLWPYPLRTIVNIALSSTFAMAILWGNELILIYNDAYRVIAADKHPRAMGRSTREIWPEVWQFNKPIFEKVMRERHAVHLEHQLFRIRRRAETEDAYFTLSYSPIWLDHDRVGGTLVTLIETTWRKHTEEALQTSQDELAEAQRIAKMGNWRLDIAANAVHWSDELYRIFEIGKTDFGNAYDSFIDRVHPDDRPQVMKINRKAKQDGEPFSIDYRIKTPAGYLKWIHETGYGIKNSNHEVATLFGIAQDITDRKMREEEIRILNTDLDRKVEERTAELHVSKERYRAVLEDQTELISRFKADGTLTFANERWGLFFGKNIKDLIGNKCQPQEYKDVLQKMSKCCEKEK